jgi:AraC-like DNA-binding protein
MLSEESQAVLAYVQHSQVAVGLCAQEDYVAQLSALWSYLDAFPKGAGEADLVAAAIAVCRVAIGFFALGGDHRIHARQGHSDCPSRHNHVNVLLCLARENYASGDLRLGRLAYRMELSIGYLSRALAAETGHSFRTHLNGIRLLAAIVRIHAGTWPLSAIAEQVGYRNTGELDRQFSRRFGLTPRRFRTLLRVLPDRLQQ